MRSAALMLCLSVPGLIAAQPAMAQPDQTLQAPLNLETATLEQLAAINGLNEDAAEALIANMEEKGPFLNWQQVAQVEGVGLMGMRALLIARVQLQARRVPSAAAPAPAGAVPGPRATTPTPPAAVPAPPSVAPAPPAAVPSPPAAVPLMRRPIPRR